MAGSIARTTTRRAASPTAIDSARVQVELAGPRAARTSLGDAAAALRSGQLRAGEAAAIEAMVQAVQLLRIRAQLAGIDDAGRAVRLILRDPEASQHGPWATLGSVSIGASNGLARHARGRARSDVLLTVDAAIHELVHVVQFGRMPSSARPHAAILEGMADAAAILATNDDTLGEGFFVTDGRGRPKGSIREIGARRASGPPLGTVVKRLDQAARPGVGEHAAGGVVSATFVAIRARLGREAAEQVLWTVIRDERAWRAGGSWRELALALRRSAQTLWPGNTTAAAAIEAAMTGTGLDGAMRDASRARAARRRTAA